MRLIRLNESEEKKIDKLLDAVFKVYENDLTDDEIARLVSNLRKQARDIISSREKVDVMINPDEEKVIHDWEDQVTTDKSPVTDDTEIVSAEKISRPDSSTDEEESEDETSEEDTEEEESDTPEDLEHDPDYDEESEETGEDSDSEKEEDPEESKDSEDETEAEEEDSSEKEEAKSNKSKKSAKNESFRLVRIRRR